MKHLFTDKEHLVRMAGLFLAGVVLFLVVRAAFVPKGFGEYGHFRTGAITDNAALPLVHAGRDACADCHADVVEVKAAGPHAGIGCEACHGALAAHVDDPSQTPTRPDPAALCLRCHESMVARPAAFPQVDPKEHAPGEICSACHVPHNPLTAPEVKP